MTNALQALLGAKPVAEITDTITMERLGTEFKIKALSMDDVTKLKEEATYYTGQGAKRKAEINEEQLGLLMIVEATVEPDFGDKALLAHFGAKTASQCVQKALLPGEFNDLTQAVVQLSGLKPASTEELDEVKN